MKPIFTIQKHAATTQVLGYPKRQTEFAKSIHLFFKKFFYIHLQKPLQQYQTDHP